MNCSSGCSVSTVGCGSSCCDTTGGVTSCSIGLGCCASISSRLVVIDNGPCAWTCGFKTSPSMLENGFATVGTACAGTFAPVILANTSLAYLSLAAGSFDPK